MCIVGFTTISHHTFLSRPCVVYDSAGIFPAVTAHLEDGKSVLVDSAHFHFILFSTAKCGVRFCVSTQVQASHHTLHLGDAQLYPKRQMFVFSLVRVPVDCFIIHLVVYPSMVLAVCAFLAFFFVNHFILGGRSKVCCPSGVKIFFLGTSSAPYIENSHCMVVAGCYLFSFFFLCTILGGVRKSAKKCTVSMARLHNGLFSGPTILIKIS
jgi:hypothetical protein